MRMFYEHNVFQGDNQDAEVLKNNALQGKWCPGADSLSGFKTIT